MTTSTNGPAKPSGADDQKKKTDRVPEAVAGATPTASSSPTPAQATGKDVGVVTGASVPSSGVKSPTPAVGGSPTPASVATDQQPVKQDPSRPQDPKSVGTIEPIQPNRPTPIQPSRVTEPTVAAKGATGVIGDTSS